MLDAQSLYRLEMRISRYKAHGVRKPQLSREEHDIIHPPMKVEVGYYAARAIARKANGDHLQDRP